MESLAKNHKRGHVLFHQRASVIAFHKCKEQSSLFTDPLLSLQRSLRSYENYGEFHAPRSIELSKKKKNRKQKKKEKERNIFEQATDQGAHVHTGWLSHPIRLVFK